MLCALKALLLTSVSDPMKKDTTDDEHGRMNEDLKDSWDKDKKSMEDIT